MRLARHAIASCRVGWPSPADNRHRRRRRPESRGRRQHQSRPKPQGVDQPARRAGSVSRRLLRSTKKQRVAQRYGLPRAVVHPCSASASPASGRRGAGRAPRAMYQRSSNRRGRPAAYGRHRRPRKARFSSGYRSRADHRPGRCRPALRSWRIVLCWKAACRLPSCSAWVSWLPGSTASALLPQQFSLCCETEANMACSRANATA